MSPLRDDSGMALVLAVGMLALISLVLGTLIDYSSATSRSASYSKASQITFALAEAGINNAEAALASPANNALDPCLLHPPTNPPGQTCASNAPFVSSYEGGSVSWYGTLNTSTNAWTVSSVGSARNPTGPTASNVTRRLSAGITVTTGSGAPNTAAWNYVFSTATSNATSCDMTLSNSAQIAAPLYVAGNLCLNNSAQVIEPNSADPVYVRVLGKLALQGSGGVGQSASQPITEADVGGGCTSSIASASHACNPNAPTSDRVWARTLNSSATPITTPVADYATSYRQANPGPQNPCTVTSGTPPVWDNDGSLNFTTYPNGSLTTAFNLTPASSYTCETRDANGAIVGQFDWNASTKTLAVKGLMYIDGSATVSNSATNLYLGQATLYLSGTFSMAQNSELCGAVAAGNCDFAGWNPNTTMLLIVAHGNDGAGNSASFSNSAQFQGGLFATNAISLGQSAAAEGPMIASTIPLSNSVTLKPLPTITTLPLGAPGSSNTHATPAAPSYGGG